MGRYLRSVICVSLLCRRRGVLPLWANTFASQEDAGRLFGDYVFHFHLMVTAIAAGAVSSQPVPTMQAASPGPLYKTVPSWEPAGLAHVIVLWLVTLSKPTAILGPACSLSGELPAPSLPHPHSLSQAALAAQPGLGGPCPPCTAVPETDSELPAAPFDRMLA